MTLSQRVRACARSRARRCVQRWSSLQRWKPGQGLRSPRSWPLRACVVCCGLGLCAGTFGCTRKAPGPEECRTFAARALGIRESAELELRSVRERYLLLTRECLTTPFDRQFIQCAETGRKLHTCQIEFELRRKLSQQVLQK